MNDARDGHHEDNNNNNNNNNGGNRGENAGEGNLIRDFIATLQGFGQQQLANQRNNTSMIVEQFRRYSPPRFDGKSGPLAMEEWIQELEMIFNHIECTDAQKVSCDVFQFCQDASYWWDLYRRSLLEQERQGLTCEGFQRIVTDNYFPPSYRNQKEAEFLDLKQGNLSITDYERKFNQLSRYVTRLIDTNDGKADRFLRGLRPEIHGILAVQGIEDYGLPVRRAQELEAGLEIDRWPMKNRDRNEKRKWEDPNYEERNMSNKKEKFEDKHEGVPQKTYPSPTCNKHHQGKCEYRSENCYYCHLPGHNALECPNKGRKETEKKGNARCFYMGKQDLEEKT